MLKILHFVVVMAALDVFPPSLEVSLREVHEHHISLWCYSYPFAVLYTGNRYVECLKRNNTRAKELGQQTLKGVTLRVGVLEAGHDFDFDCGLKREQGQWTPNAGYTSHILELLQEVLQFEITYVPLSRWLRGDISDGAGLLHLLESNKTDLVVCHWTISKVILQSADYLRPTLQTAEAFVFVPKNLHLAQDVLIRTFSIQLWVFFFFAICTLAVSFKFSTYVHSRLRPDHEHWSWNEVILWAVATVSQQSYNRHPRGSSCRVMFLIGYAVSYLMYTGFTAGITSLLALCGHRNWLSFDDIHSLNLKLLFHRDEFYFDYLENDFKKTSAFASYLLHSEFKDLREIFRKITHENSVGYGTMASFLNHLKKIDPSEREDYFVFPLPLCYRQKSFLIRKSLPLKNIFDYWLLKFNEIGLLDLGEKRFLKVRGNNVYSGNPWLSVDVKNVFSAVVLLTGGWILSFLILILEIIWKTKLRKPIKNIAF